MFSTSPGRGGLCGPSIDKIPGSCATRFTRTGRLDPNWFWTTTFTDAPLTSNGTCALITPGDTNNNGAGMLPNKTRVVLPGTCVSNGGPIGVIVAFDRLLPKIDTSDPGASDGDSELRSVAEFTIPDGVTD